MQDIVRITAPVPTAHAADGGLARINAYEDLRSGQYWRSKDAIPELLKPEKRRRGVHLPADHPDYRAHGGFDQNRIGSEEYLVDVPVRAACPADLLLLVRSLGMVDGGIHAVTLSGHPGETVKARTYLIDEFLEHFELVGEAEAQAIRDAEVEALRSRIAEAQRLMMAGPPAEAAVPMIGRQSVLPARPGVGAMIANIGQIERLQATAEHALTLAETNAKWITEHVTAIGRMTAEMVPFFKERASAALATTEGVMRYATELRRGVESLGLYVGTGVELKRLAEGPSADPAERLVIQREMLFMDEEFVVNVGQSADWNGADHEDFDDFVEALAVEGPLRRRVLPFPRMVVLMQYRRKDRRYVAGDDYAAAMANASYNEPNRVRFLLIRDGENLFQVWSDLTVQTISELYPTTAMGEKPFTGIDGETIGIDDLHLSTAKDKFKDLNRTYKRLLILLWGLNDRDGVFGTFYRPLQWTSNGFIDEAFQRDRFTFWDPYGDVAMIGSGRPAFSDWVRAANGWLRSGSRVIALRDALRPRSGGVVERQQPGAVSTIGDGEAHEYVVRKANGRHVVSVGARTRSVVGMTVAALDEEGEGWSDDRTLRWLCLDMVEASDVDHYLESRRDRPAYMGFHGLLLQVRELLRAQEAHDAPMIDLLQAAFAHSDRPVPDGIDLRTTARHAIRLWRAAGRGRQVPPAGDTAHADAVKALLGSMWTLAGNDHPVAEAEMLATAEGRLPLRLVLTGRDSFALYATSIGDEIEDRLFPHLWTTRIACKRKASGLRVTSRRVTALPQAVADEETLHEWAEAAQWVGRSVPAILQEHGSYEEPHPNYGYETIRKAFTAVGRGRVGRLLDDEADVEAAVAALIAESHAATGRRTHVVNVLAIEPFAVVRRTAFHSERAEGFSSRWNHVPVTSAYLVLSLQDDAFRALYRRAVGDRARALVAEAYASQYKDKAYQRRQFVETVGRPPEIVTSNLTEWSKPGADSVSKPRSWRGMALEANWSETLRQLDVRRMPDGSGDLWAPRLDEMLVWMDPAAPAVLNALCERHGWGPAPYVPWPRG